MGEKDVSVSTKKRLFYSGMFALVMKRIVYIYTASISVGSVIIRPAHLVAMYRTSMLTWSACSRHQSQCIITHGTS